MDINKIYNMDCMDGLKELKDNSIDLIITDPPYEVNYMEKIKSINEAGRGTDKHITQSVDCGQAIDFNFLAASFYRLLKDNRDLYMFCTEKQISKIVPIFEKQGFKFCQLLVWIKPSSHIDATFGNKYMYQHELLLYFKKGWQKLNCSSNRSSVFIEKSSNDRANYVHPTQKPTFILNKLILNSSKEWQVVLDPFAGSGNILLAARNNLRKYIGFEISEHYFNVINDRLMQESIPKLLNMY